MNKLLSIAIPAYNISSYIDKIVDSLISIKMKDMIEIIIVNDGSKDNTLELAYDYKEKYPDCIIVIDKENGGHGSTINSAIDVATGKYFKVIDGDDWVDSEQLDLLMNSLVTVDDDMLICNYVLYYDDNGEQKKESDIPIGMEVNKTYSINEFCRKSTNPCTFHSSYFKTDIYKKSRKIDENCFYVDVEYVLFPLKNVKTVRMMDYYVYIYRIGREGQSVSLDSYMKNKNNLITVVRSLLLFIKEKGMSDEIINYVVLRIKYLFRTILSIYFLIGKKREANLYLKSLIIDIKRNYPMVYKKIKNKKLIFVKLFNFNGYYFKYYLLKYTNKLGLR